MPATYDYQARNTRISCSRCDNYVTVEGRPSGVTGESTVLASYGPDRGVGTLVSDWLRFLPNRGRFHAWCRSCERAARQEASRDPNRQTRRATARAPRVADGIARRHENR